MRKIDIAILAAGESKRLGRPKQLLTWAGRPLIHYIAQEALSVAPSRCLVVLGAGHLWSERALKGLPVSLVVNDQWRLGLSSSIGHAVEFLEDDAEAILFLLADQPFLNRSTIRLFLEQYRSGADEVIAATYDGTIGAPMLFGASWFQALKSLQGDRGAKQLLADTKKPVRLIGWPEGAIDLDTEEDVRKAQQMKKG